MRVPYQRRSIPGSSGNNSSVSSPVSEEVRMNDSLLLSFSTISPRHSYIAAALCIYTFSITLRYNSNSKAIAKLIAMGFTRDESLRQDIYHGSSFFHLQSAVPVPINH